MLISETEYRYQVEEDIKPFRDVLLGLFFVTIGMLLDLREVVEHWPGCCSCWSALLVLQVAADHRRWAALFGSDPGTALRTGLALAQAGEFGFVLLALAGRAARARAASAAGRCWRRCCCRCWPRRSSSSSSEHIVRRLSAADWMHRAMALHNIAVQSHGRRAARDHLRLRAQRPESGAPAGAGERSRSSRSTSIRSACERPRPRARAWCSAMRRGAKC